MLENLINIVKENAGDAIINNPAIPNEKNDDAINTAASSIFDTLKENFAGGKGLSSITGMFKEGNLENNPVFDQIKNKVGNNLAGKFGLSSASAGEIVSKLIPQVMSQFVNKTNDPNDNSLTLDGILGSFGGKSGGLFDKLKKLF